MKTNCTRLSWLGLILWTTTLPAQNVAINPGFETGNTAGWFFFGSPTISAQTNQVHSGNYAALVTNRTATWMGIAQSFQGALQPNQSSIISAWLKLAGGPTQTMQLTMQKIDGNGATHTAVASGSVSASGWTHLSGQYTLYPSGSLTSLTLYAEVPFGASTAYYIDDVEVLPIVRGSTNGFDYSSDGSTITITGYPGEPNMVIIPDTIAGLPVTCIGDHAFAYKFSMESVTIPNSVVQIGKEAFNHCSSLPGITIPGSVTSLGENAFRACYNLTNVTIPAAVTNIGRHAFISCIKLLAIDVEAANPVYGSLDGVLMNKNLTRLLVYPSGRLDNYTIPASVTVLASNAFISCQGPGTVTIPNNVKHIEAEAFWMCGVTNVTIAGSVTNIGSAAFSDCTILTSVTLLPGITRIGDWMFQGCFRLGHLTIPIGVTHIGTGAFRGSSVGNISLPASVTHIGEYAFNHCNGLRAITIPDGVRTISDGTFLFCQQLESLTIGSGVTNIGHSAFENCRLTNVTIPNNVKKIETAFALCKSLTNVTLGTGVTIISNGAFGGCDSLLTFDVNASNPAYSSFDGVLFNKNRTRLVAYPGGRLGSYAVPSGVTSIGGSAFNSCTKLTGIAFPDGLTNIAANAFRYCPNLTNVVIPASVTSIESEAFAVCEGLKGVYFRGNAPSFGNAVFQYASPSIYYLPGTTGWSATFDGLPTTLWNPLIQSRGPGFGVGPAGFCFHITGTTNIPIVVEATTNLARDTWVALKSLSLTNGDFYFSDPAWRNFPARLYRIRSP